MRFATLVLLLVACAGQVAPSALADAPTAAPIPAASATEAGVTVDTRADAWNGRRLGDKLLPLKVELQNDGTRPIEVLYTHASLQAGKKSVHPWEIVDMVSEVQPPDRGFGYDTDCTDSAYETYLGRWCAPTSTGATTATPGSFQGLPPEMLKGALPEGVLKPGDKSVGFLYFDRPEGKIDSFKLKLIDAETGDDLGTVVVPYGGRAPSVALRE